MKRMHERISGVAGAYPRLMYRCCGYTDEELQRPLIGAVTAYFEGHPAPPGRVRSRPKRSRRASGWPAEPWPRN